MITWLMRRCARLPLLFPKAVMIVCLGLTVLAAVFLPRLHVSTDRNLLAGQDNESFRARERVNELFGTSLVAVVTIVGKDNPETVHKAADEIAAKLDHHKKLIRDVFHKADVDFFERHALLFLPLDKVEELPEVLDRSVDGLELVAEADGLPSLLTGALDLMTGAPAPKSQDAEEAATALGFLGSVLDDFTRWFKDPSMSGLSVSDELWRLGPSMNSNPSSKGYLVEKDGKPPHLALIFVQPASNSQSMEVVAPLTDLLRSEAASVIAKYPGFKVHVTGMPSIITDEMRAVSRDCVVAGIVSGLGVLLVFILAFRSLRISLFLVLPLGVGLIWSAGLTAAIFGHLTLITSYFAAVLFGIGVAFTIHIVSRFHEALRSGADKKAAIEIALTRAGPGVVVGGGTTALAFLAIAFSEFKGFSEMGIISGSGVTLILIANFTLLPAMLLLWHPGVSAIREQSRSAFWVNLARSRVVIPVLAFAGFILGIVLIPKIEFDYAVESLLPQNVDSVKGMKIMDSRTDFSMNYSIALADSLESAETLRKRFESLDTVSRAEALSMFIPTGQKKRIAALRTISAAIKEPANRALSGISEHLGNLGKTNAKILAESLTEFGDGMEDLMFDAKRAGRPEAEPLLELVRKTRAAQATVAASGDDDRARALEHTIFDGLKRGMDVLTTAIDDRGFTIADLPKAVRGRYLSQDGKHFAVIVFPKGDIGNIDFFERHVAELKSVSSDITGHPITHLDFTHMVHRGFKDAVILSAIAVVLLILLDLRSPGGLALSLVPVLMGLGWTMVALWALKLKFNYANLMALPILIGTGVDYGAHLAHRAKQEGNIREAARTTGRAIALTGLTTLIGFGSLLLGQHWGVRSLGMILVIGIASSLVAALVVIPAIVGRKKEA